MRRKAELLDLDMPPEVSEYIANKLKSNIRQLEGVVKKLKAYKLLVGSPTTILIAQNAIRDIFNDSQPIQVTVERIISEVDAPTASPRTRSAPEAHRPHLHRPAGERLCDPGGHPGLDAGHRRRAGQP